LLSKRRLKKSSVTYRIEKRNFFKKDISDYDVIYAYLLPAHMKKVWKKISTEYKKGTLLYSSAFEVAGQIPKEKMLIAEKSYLYVYEV
jgi:hypothetical protein